MISKFKSKKSKLGMFKVSFVNSTKVIRSKIRVLSFLTRNLSNT